MISERELFRIVVPKQCLVATSINLRFLISKILMKKHGYPKHVENGLFLLIRHPFYGEIHRARLFLVNFLEEDVGEFKEKSITFGNDPLHEKVSH